MPSCPSCEADNPDAARFCSSCGTPLAGAPGRKERKFATALFADLVGSTALGEREDPEVVQSLVGEAFERLSAEVARYGGTLEKFIGDAVLALFGVPASHEDDPERAVRAALEMQAVLSEMNRGLVAEGKPRLDMRIGVEAGEVLVDLERAAGVRDRIVTGDAVNTAARLQGAADPGHVLVGPAVYASTKDVIDFREVTPLDLKGKAEPVPAWEALRVRARRRGERAPLGLEARLVGRDQELALLKQTFHRVEAEGRPALATVLGPAGVGKSRLALELFRYVEGLPQFVYWRKGRCLAYGNVAYSALAEAVKAQCEILEDDPTEVAGDKADRAVEELFGDRAVAEQVRALVGAATRRSFAREDLFDGWRRFLERMAARYPLVLVLEDIHWADEGLLDFVDHLADWAQGPILVLTMARPELLDARPGWGGGKRNYAAIYLDPLTEPECAAMVEDLLAGSLPPELERLVVARSEGNPLFAEEIVRMFIDRGILRPTAAGRWEVARPIEEVEVPRSIQGLIAARLDALPAEEKAVLQDAAVVGRTFWLGAVGELSRWAGREARDILSRLRVKEIVIPREPPTFSGELEFAFRHVLIRDVAYDSIPKRVRAEKHAQVAGWARDRAGDRSEEIAELIASHYAEALRYLREVGGEASRQGELERAAYRWARAAAERASRLWLADEAVRWYRMALDLAETVGAGPAELAGLLDGHASAAYGVRPLPEVAEGFERALALYEEQGRDLEAGRVEVRLAQIAWNLGDHEQATRRYREALDRLDPLGDTPALAEALSERGRYLWRTGAHEEAERSLRRSIEVARKVGARVAEGESLVSLSSLLITRGDWEEGLPLKERAYVLAREIGDLALFLRASNNLASMYKDYAAPDNERVEAILLEALDLARRSGRRDFEMWLTSNLSNRAFHVGHLDDCERYAAESAEAARALGEDLMVAAALVLEARARLLKGDVEGAERLQRESEALEPVETYEREPQALPWVWTFQGWLARARGEEERALRCFLQGIELLGPKITVGMGELLLFEAVASLVRLGRGAEAGGYLERLRAVARGRPHAEAFDRWGEGLLEQDPERRAGALRDAVERFRGLGRPIDEARSLMDLAEAEAEAGGEARPHLERARDLLTRCGAGLYLRELEVRFPRGAAVGEGRPPAP